MGLDELTMERVQDDVEIETEGQSDAFAVCIVSFFFLMSSRKSYHIYLAIRRGSPPSRMITNN